MAEWRWVKKVGQDEGRGEIDAVAEIERQRREDRSGERRRTEMTRTRRGTEDNTTNQPQPDGSVTLLSSSIARRRHGRRDRQANTPTV